MTPVRTLLRHPQHLLHRNRVGVVVDLSVAPCHRSASCRGLIPGRPLKPVWGSLFFFHIHNLEANKGGGPKTRETKNVLFTPSLGRVRRPCRGLEKFSPPVLQCCYGCSFDAQEIVHTSQGMLCFFFFRAETIIPNYR